MTLADAIVALLRARGPMSRAEIERALDGWAAKSIAVTLWRLKRGDRIAHLRRAAYKTASLYGLPE